MQPDDPTQNNPEVVESWSVNGEVERLDNGDILVRLPALPAGDYVVTLDTDLAGKFVFHLTAD